MNEMFIDHKLLSEEALHGLIKDYLTRCDFDSSDCQDQQTQVAKVIDALNRQKMIITWSELHQSFNIQDKDSFDENAYEEDETAGY